MDKAANGKEEATRESLISISYALPEKIPNSKPSSDKVNNETPLDSDGDDKFRSELISISYTPSPDVGEGSPVAPEGQLKG